MVEALPTGTEVHAEMAYGAQRHILSLIGIEQTRLLNGSGPQVKFFCLFECVLIFHFGYLISICKYNQYHNFGSKSVPKTLRVRSLSGGPAAWSIVG